MAIKGYLISAWQNHDGDLRPLTNIYHSLTLMLVRSVVLLGHSHVWAAWARAFYTPHKGYFTIPHATKYTVLKHIKPVPERENAACKIHTKADGYCWISTREGWGKSEEIWQDSSKKMFSVHTTFNTNSFLSSNSNSDIFQQTYTIFSSSLAPSISNILLICVCHSWWDLNNKEYRY